jgi:hypothetical protein
MRPPGYVKVCSRLQKLPGVLMWVPPSCGAEHRSERDIKKETCKETWST